MFETDNKNAKIASDTLKEIRKRKRKDKLYMKEFIEQTDNLITRGILKLLEIKF